MPNAFYCIRLIHGVTRKPCPGERVWDAGQLVRGSVVRFLRARNQQGYDIYLLPYAEQCNAGYILIDLDHATADLVPRMRANGHEPCVVLQSSPGHLQAWIRVSTTPLEPALATAISKQLARTYGGDLASTDGCHLGRLAGFTNQKLQRRTARGYAPWVKIVEAHAGIARAAPELLHSATQRIEQPSTAAMRDITYRLSQVGNPSTSITALGAAHIYQRWTERWHIRERFSQPDWSIIDLWLARKLLAMHVSTAQVEAILRLGSPNFPRHHGDPEGYLRRTLARAALPPPRPVCSAQTTVPLLPRDATGSANSNPRGGR
jgi:RepB DNA-primase N-terminal domain/RepB DNA-primase C-terminal helical domain